MKCRRLLKKLIDHTDVRIAVDISLVKGHAVDQLHWVPGFQDGSRGSPEVLLNALKHTCKHTHILRRSSR